MKVLDGTQSESTHAPPAPSVLDDRHLGPELGRHQGGLVARRAAPDDHDAAHRHSRRTSRHYGPLHSPSRPEPTIVIAVRLYAAYGSNLDPGRMRAYCPHSPLVGIGWLEGWRLTFGGEDLLGYEGAVCTIVESETDGRPGLRRPL